MANTKKLSKLSGINDFLGQNTNFALVKFEKTTHIALESLRKQLKASESKMKVVKNSLFEKSINKLGFGLLNGLTGWTALFFEPMREENKFTGIVKGSWRTITNTVGGALHILTFPVPIDIPLPDGGVNFE